jgi:hypothetical protein
MPSEWDVVASKPDSAPGEWDVVSSKPDQSSWLDSAKDAVTNYAKNVWGELADQGQGMVDAAKGLTSWKGAAQIPKGIGESQDAVRLKAEDAFNRGDYAEGIRHTLSYLVPFMGPSIDKRGDQAQRGDVSGALGGATTLGLQAASGGLKPETVSDALDTAASTAEKVTTPIKQNVARGAKATGAGIRAAAPDVAQGTAKTAAGAGAAYLAHEMGVPDIVDAYFGAKPTMSGLAQVGQGLVKGGKAAVRSWKNNPPPAFANLADRPPVWADSPPPPPPETLPDVSPIRTRSTPSGRSPFGPMPKAPPPPPPPGRQPIWANMPPPEPPSLPDVEPIASELPSGRKVGTGEPPPRPETPPATAELPPEPSTPAQAAEGPPLPAQALEPWQVAKKDLIQYSDTRPKAKYTPDESGGYSEAEMNARSIRNRNAETEPPTVNQFPVGSWGVDSTGELMQLREYALDDPRLIFPEGRPSPGNQVVQKYLGWMREGSEPPPLTGLETEKGNIKIQEGHHRAAAIQANGGNTVKVWTTVTQNRPLGNGQVMPEGITHAQAVERAVAAGKPVPPEVLADYQEPQPLTRSQQAKADADAFNAQRNAGAPPPPPLPTRQVPYSDLWKTPREAAIGRPVPTVDVKEQVWDPEGFARSEAYRKLSNEHMIAVQDALDAGKPVPPEVLADYPQLRSKAPPAPAGNGTQPSGAPPKINLTKAELNAYQNSIRQAGFKNDPAAYPGNQPGISWSDSFRRNTRGQVPKSVRTFQAKNLPQFAQDEGITVPDARARLKASGWLVKESQAVQ